MYWQGKGGGGGDGIDPIAAAREVLQKTHFSQPYRLACALIVCAIPVSIVGLALDKETEHHTADDVLLLIGTTMNGIAYFILETIGCLFLKEKWVGCTCCVVVVMYPIRCGACCTSMFWLGLLISLIITEKGTIFSIVLMVMSFVGVFVTYSALLIQFANHKRATEEVKQPEEKNQQAPKETSEKNIPEESLAEEGLADGGLLGRLKDLKRAKESGLLTETEFQQTKADLISNFTGSSKS